MRDFILSRVVYHTGLSYLDLRSKCRLKDFSEARQVLVYLLYENADMTIVCIGKMTNRHHSTISYAKKSISNYRTIPYYDDSKQMRMLRTIEKEIKSFKNRSRNERPYNRT